MVGGGGGNHRQQQHEAADRGPSPSSVDNQDSVDDVASVTSGVDPPELLPAHEIASEIEASEPVDDEDDDNLADPQNNNNPRLDPDDEDPDQNNEDDEEVETTVMIDTSDFRGLSEPTYQTLNGRMTPPGFPTSSSYATLTPLQPLPPISTMSDKFSHYGHHPGNGGFALMQNSSSLGMASNYHHHHHQYDKLGSAMAAAGMNMGVSLGSGNVIIGSANHQSVVQQHHAAAAAAMMNHSNGHNSHSQSNHGMSSPPYGHSNGLSSPDKSLSPTNGYDYSSGQRVLESPHSPSSVNLHSPTSLMPALNGMPSTPPSAQMPPSPCNDHKPIGLASPHTNSPRVTYVTSSGQEVKVATSMAGPPHHVTVLQSVTPTPAAVAPSAQTVTIVQANVSSHLTATIMSTPVAVVTTANVLQHQQQMQQLQHQNQNQSNHSHVGNSKQATGGSKNCINSRSSDSSAASGDELEEINTKELAQRISAELKRYSIPQAIFAQRVLCRSQGTLSDLLRNPKPWSKLKSGRETFRRMSKWLEEPEFQRMSALRLAGQLQHLNIQFGFVSYYYLFCFSFSVFIFVLDYI